jgi:hypothetical protein
MSVKMSQQTWHLLGKGFEYAGELALDPCNNCRVIRRRDAQAILDRQTGRADQEAAREVAAFCREKSAGEDEAPPRRSANVP